MITGKQQENKLDPFPFLLIFSMKVLHSIVNARNCTYLALLIQLTSVTNHITLKSIPATLKLI